MSGTNLRFINTLILSLLLVLTLTGVYGLFFPFPSFLFEIHRIAAWALILLIPWKAIISLRSLGRGVDRRLDRNVMIVVSVAASIATIIIIIFGLLWKWNLGEYYLWIAGYGYTAIGWHWGIALYLLLPLFALHAWRRWPHPKKTDFSGRRQVLKLIGLGVASVATWGISEVLARNLQDKDVPRRFTGSREEGSFAGNDHPVTSGPNQGKIKLDPSTWNLRLTGAVKTPLTLSYADVLALSISEVTAILDCTGGWYTTQIWRGIPLTDLLARAEIHDEAIGIVLKGVSEYTASFTLIQAEEILLATYVGEEVLEHKHGYPLRAVVPSRRGWHWVKWLTEIEVITISTQSV
ncbi:MAG: molybdopterin-dependent oxidoreductase [Anaerolineae bacterium]|nr:molybdopterin-dependent oxidoreductase [Anaerolineae bacterium]MCI0610516.1 molybdopterin-dependent oxidoreductase [Anaerolineae bacterium]